MGIPYYFYTIYKKYNSEGDLTINEDHLNNLDIDCLFLDYNSMIHPCAQRELEFLSEFEENMKIADIEEKIIDACINYTRYIMNIIKAEQTFIMIDGVAPRAKINQQRERRYKSHFFKELHFDNKTFTNQMNWNSNKITPGTLFMEKLSKRLELLQKESPFKITISDSNEPGEGEHKMTKYINNMNIEKKICIYGLDADLIMLSLMNKYADNIILIRDNTFNTKLSEKERVYTYLNINKLKTLLKQELNTSEIDYIFLCFLLGNDFLEHLPSVSIKENGLSALIKIYVKCQNVNNNNSQQQRRTLVNLQALDKGEMQNSINISMLKSIFYELSKSEEYFFKNVLSVYKKDSVYRDNLDLNSQYKNVFFYTNDVIQFNKDGFKERYYKYYNVTDIDKLCKEYLTGLYWTLGYYKNHVHQNWTWYYPYDAVPFASDIYSYLHRNKLVIEINESKPNDPLTQLFMVLPKDSLVSIIQEQNPSLYNKLKRVFNTQSVILNNYYPSKIYLDMIHKEYLWQSKVFLKNFDTKVLQVFTL